MDYKITVIIPCYNCEDTLNRAVDSVIGQSFGFENIELILYDDNSSDNTRAVINSYADKYNNIIPFFSDVNSGFPGKGRNEGIRRASAEFVMFMDNDDEYDEDICQNLFNEVNSSNSDLVACNYLNYDDLSCSKGRFNYNYGELDDNRVIFTEDAVYFSCRLIWCCIFKKKILVDNDIWFPEDNLAEDVYFLSLYYLYVKKIVYLTDYYGIYRHTQSDSHSNSLTLYKINRLFDIYENIIEIYSKQNKNYNYAMIFEDRVQVTLIQLYTSNALEDTSENIYKFFNRFREYEISIEFNRDLNFLLNFANKFILGNHFYLAKKYLKFLRFIHTSKLFRTIYRRIFE